MKIGEKEASVMCFMIYHAFSIASRINYACCWVRRGLSYSQTILWMICVILFHFIDQRIFVLAGGIFPREVVFYVFGAFLRCAGFEGFLCGGG